MRGGTTHILESASAALEEDRRAEEEAERARGELFGTRFPGIARVPVFGRAVGAVYAHGFPYVLFLLFSILLCTAIKAPYLGVPFTGEHSMKYNTYVEPATYMVQNGTMLWNQKRYVADPLHNPDGIFDRFDHLPLMEWGLYLTYRLFPGAGIEARTRAFTHFIGILILLAAYRFLCLHFPKRFAVLSVGLLSLNPVFSFSTYVTVLDSIAILSMFLSLTQLAGYLRNGNASRLVWAAAWFGLGNAVKYPLFLWLAPIALLYTYCGSRDTVSFVNDYVLYVSVALLTTFGLVLLTGKLIGSPATAGLLALSLGILLILSGILLGKHKDGIHRGFAWLLGNRVLLAVAVAAAAGTGFLLFRGLRLGDFADEFLTDGSLVANPRLYKYMLFHQFKEYMTRNLFWISLGGIPLALLTREKPMRRVWIPFLFGSLVYWVVASKSIFFHIYYSLVIAIALTLSAAYFLYFVTRTVKHPLPKVLVSLCFLSLLLPPVLDATNGRMQNYADVGKVVGYIKENTKPDEFILFEGFLTPLSIYTQRGFVMPAVLIDDAFREDVHALGFASAMRKYRIRYLFTPNETPYYMDYAPLFEPMALKEPSGQNHNRIITIYKAIGVSKSDITDGLRRAEEVENAYRIREKFALAEQFGRYKFYSFRN